MKILFFILLTIAMPVNAEVFKCVGSDGLIKYQSTPCVDAAITKQVEIKSRSAQKEMEAVENFRKWTAQKAAQKAAQAEKEEAQAEKAAQAEKERLNFELRAAEVNALQRTADAHFDEIDVQNRQAQAQEDANKLQVYQIGAQNRQAQAQEKANALKDQYGR
jgi:hypothetical protein